MVTELSAGPFTFAETTPGKMFVIGMKPPD
jgi:hypothetical protein